MSNRAPRRFPGGLVCLLAGALAFCPRPAGAAPALKDPPKDTPTDTEFCLAVDHLIDNVADLDTRRFTILIKGDRKVELGVAGATAVFGGEPKPVGDEAPGVYRTECIVLVRLKQELAPGARQPVPTIHRLVKLGRGVGASIEGKMPAGEVKDLKSVVQITAKPGRHPVGQRVVIAKVHGQEISIIIK